MYVCMYVVCMYVFIYICMYVCIYDDDDDMYLFRHSNNIKFMRV